MKAENIRAVEINTTAFKEENFILVTDLTDEEIENVIRPIVAKERNETDEEEYYYDNVELVGALEEVYPNNFILVYYTDSIELITI
jgi:hypothetical protein